MNEIKTHQERFDSFEGRTRIDCMQAEIDELRERQDLEKLASRGGVLDLLKRAISAIEACKDVLHEVAQHGGRTGVNAEGVGGSLPGVLKGLQAALAEDALQEPKRLTDNAIAGAYYAALQKTLRAQDREGIRLFVQEIQRKVLGL